MNAGNIAHDGRNHVIAAGFIVWQTIDPQLVKFITAKRMWETRGNRAAIPTGERQLFLICKKCIDTAVEIGDLLASLQNYHRLAQYTNRFIQKNQLLEFHSL